jgi:hypothetical protein
MNPYTGLQNHQLWRRGMTNPAPSQIRFVSRTADIGPQHTIMTLGSCFAQRLGRELGSLGLQLFQAEPPPPDMTLAEAVRRNYGIYTARYGNVYTPKQALQLLRRSLGLIPPPVEAVWEREGRFIDALRPAIEPDGWDTPDDVVRATAHHLACVKEAFTKCDRLIMTLGLTEAWQSLIDGTIYPVAPGVAGGSFDAARHAFVNFSATQTTDDLMDFLALLRHANPTIHVVLTVSPVSMIATYEPRHVWESTLVSKASLRVAADAAERAFTNVTYFPAYEIVTSPASGGRYVADDLRQVSELGIKQVMRAFRHEFLANDRGHDGLPRSSAPLPELSRSNSADGVVCDEELIAMSLNR